jgi:hypothetical protein
VWKSITANTGKQIASQALSIYKNSTTQKLNQWGNRPLYSIDAAGNLSLGWYNSYVYKCNISAGSCSTGTVPGTAGYNPYANYN